MTENFHGLYIRLGHLIANMPDLSALPVPRETLDWLAEVQAVVDATGDMFSSAQLETEIQSLISGRIPGANRENKAYFILKNSYVL
jgi:hypothetical protein